MILEGGYVNFRVSLPFIEGESEFFRILDPNAGYSFGERGSTGYFDEMINFGGCAMS